MTLDRVPALTLFTTPIFREAPFVRRLCAEIGEVFVTRDVSARGHFTAYFAVITARRYDNPHRADLYLLHELWHMRCRHAQSDGSWFDWIRRRADSEFQASVLSECMVYFHIEGLRERTFDHEIWVDRFGHLRGQPIAAIQRQIEAERMRALSAPRYDDFIEWQIHSYGAQNMQWYRIWGEPVGYGSHAAEPAFRVVERHLSEPGWEGGHAAWVAEVCDAGVPFARQAVAFEAVYDETVRLWGNQFFRA